MYKVYFKQALLMLKQNKFISMIAGEKMKKVCSGRKENKLYL